MLKIVSIGMLIIVSISGCTTAEERIRQQKEHAARVEMNNKKKVLEEERYNKELKLYCNNKWSKLKVGMNQDEIENLLDKKLGHLLEEVGGPLDMGGGVMTLSFNRNNKLESWSHKKCK